MINWEEFDHIHVINKLKQVLGSWWNVDLVFTDERGHIKGYNADTKFCNPSTKTLLDKESSRTSLTELVATCIEELRSSENKSAIRKWNTTGYDIAVVPIVIENEILGAVVATGFLKDKGDQLNEIKERFAIFGLNNKEIEDSLAKIQYIDEADHGHFIDLVELVSEEIITLHVEISSRESRIDELNKELGSRYKYDNMIGKSKPMQTLYSLLDKVKNANSTVMIQGENGTGKELIAKALHYNSPRKGAAFVIQNCSAFNDNLLESELFGHVKGSFTGAIKDKKGLFSTADRGTFFLDEIGDTSPTMQVKLLRVLQDGTFTPVGSTEVRKVDVRIIAATNKNLKEMVDEGTFREDLYYRLNVININVPALRERKEDIPLLVDYFLKNTENADESISLTNRALEKLYDYSWPGNVRELQNEIERIVVLSGSEGKIMPEMLSPKILEASTNSKVQGSRIMGKLKDALENLEREMIQEGLRRTGWNKSKLAKELGISRAGLIMKVDKYDLDKRKLTKKSS